MPFPLFAPRRPHPLVAPALPVGAPVAEIHETTEETGAELRESSGQERHSRTPRGVHSYGREAAALLLIASALFISLALVSFRADPLRPDVVGGDWVGPVGASLAHALVTAVGVAGWFIPLELVFFSAPLLRSRRTIASIERVGGDVVVIVILAALLHVAVPDAKAFGGMPFGGSVGELFGSVMRTLFSTLGSYIIGGTVLSLILIGRATFSFIEFAKSIESAWRSFYNRTLSGVGRIQSAWVDARKIDREQREAARDALEPQIRLEEAEAIVMALADPVSDFGDRDSSEVLISNGSTTDEHPLSRSLFGISPDAPNARPKERAPKTSQRSATKTSDLEPAPGTDSAEEESDAAPIDPLEVERTQLEASPSAEAEVPSQPQRQKARLPQGPRIVDTSSALEAEKPARVIPSFGEGFKLPSTDMLDPAPGSRIVVNEEQLKVTAQRLEKVLSDYGVSGKVEEIHPGPTVTTFEVSPAAGTKVSKVAGLADDLALGLSRKVRIIAPIPGKNRIGFEIPNEVRSPVSLRELIEDRRFMEMKAPLPCVLGRDIIGAPFFADMASMPHVIVAGATGAGKSVGLNVMLVSLLFRCTPDELKLLMIDPKVVELAPFDRIPHMLLPVVTDMKQASNALKWAVDEMERRYQLFANAGTRNITTYNALIEKVRRGEAKAPRPPAKVSAVLPDGTETEVLAAKDGTDTELPEKIPSIVIVVDEFADLMMQQGKDVEASVARLAQKARAAGMHVILATQRPSVDVITGIIKANFPTRIAFRVSQKVDSRTILDEQGAENLLGKGDMLVKMNGSNDTRRVQCPFCSEEEVQRVTDFLRAQGEPVYDDAILKPRDEEASDGDTSDAEADPMYDAAVRIVADTRRCSTSWIQRKLGVGYNRAAKIVEAMEKRGIVGPANGAKDREVLIGPI